MTNLLQFQIPMEISAKLWYTIEKRGHTPHPAVRYDGFSLFRMEQAINAYYMITASPEFRETERLREKARHDEAQALYHAEQKGIQKGIQQGIQKGVAERNIEIARNLLKTNLPLEQISMATGLTIAEIERLRIET